MNTTPAGSPPSFRLVRLFWIGLVLFTVGSVPHLVFNLLSHLGYLLRADHPRLAIRLFLPAMITFLPGIICMVWGAGTSLFRYRQALKWHRDPSSRPAVALPGGPPSFKLPGMFWFGFITFLGCCGPLLLTILCTSLGLTDDPNPNPVFFGIMAAFAFWPSVLCMIGGLIDAILTHQKAKKRFALST